MKINCRLVTIMITIAFLFLTTNAKGVTCTYNSENVPKGIPDLGTIVSTLNVPDSLLIRDIDVVVNIMHTYDADLVVSLVAPNGREVELFSLVGSNVNNFIETRLDDEASLSITAPSPWVTAPYTGSYTPEGKLSDLDGLDSKGTWQLKIRDVNPADVGVLKSWSLIIDFAEPTPINPQPADGIDGVPVNAAPSWDTESGASDVTWDAYFGTDPNALQQVASDLTSPNFCPGRLDNGITYYWQVVAKKACVTTPGPIWSFKTFVYKIIWVSFHGDENVASAGAVTAGFIEAPDRGYTDLLKASGYDVVRYVQTGTPDVNMLNAADLVIVSRSVASGSFNTAAATRWNTTVTAPMIITNGYLTRKSRLGLMTGSTIPDITGDIMLTVSDPTHPIFAGIQLSDDGTMNNQFAGVVLYPDGTTLARGISVIIEPADAEATVLATVSAALPGGVPAGSVMIAEYPAGATVEHDGPATDVLAGRRLVFLTGSREANGKNSEGTGMLDLFPDGQKMFINAVRYMLGIQPVEISIENYSFEDPNSKQKCWNGENLNTETPDDPNDYFTDVPGWSSDTAATDSGIEGPDAWPGRTDGVMTGFLRGTDPSAWNLTDFVIKASDDFILFVDARDNWTESASMPAKLQMTLYYLVDGVRTPLATTTVELTTTWNTYSLAFAANSVLAAVGSEIGIELTNATATNNSWIGMDNVHLFDLSGEYPLDALVVSSTE